MWIRSQNKYGLIDINGSVLTVSNYEGKGPVICADNKRDLILLGTYKSIDRAIDILQEIQGAIASYEVDKNFNLSSSHEMPLRELYPVYEMPKE